MYWMHLRAGVNEISCSCCVSFRVIGDDFNGRLNGNGKLEDRLRQSSIEITSKCSQNRLI
jgi:hypothetical protein